MRQHGFGRGWRKIPTIGALRPFAIFWPEWSLNAHCVSSSVVGSPSFGDGAGDTDSEVELDATDFAESNNHNKEKTTVDALTLLAVAGLIALGNGLVLWQLNNVKKDLGNRIDEVKTDLGNRIDGHERECAERNRENAERDRKLHATIGGLIHAVEGNIPHPSA